MKPTEHLFNLKATGVFVATLKIVCSNVVSGHMRTSTSDLGGSRFLRLRASNFEEHGARPQQAVLLLCAFREQKACWLAYHHKSKTLDVSDGLGGPVCATLCFRSLCSDLLTGCCRVSIGDAAGCPFGFSVKDSKSATFCEVERTACRSQSIMDVVLVAIISHRDVANIFGRFWRRHSIL